MRAPPARTTESPPLVQAVTGGEISPQQLATCTAKDLQSPAGLIKRAQIMQEKLEEKQDLDTVEVCLSLCGWVWVCVCVCVRGCVGAWVRGCAICVGGRRWWHVRLRLAVLAWVCAGARGIVRGRGCGLWMWVCLYVFDEVGGRGSHAPHDPLPIL